jgi:DNA-directed RNA polymerase I, II, and III subunit RPABC2
MSDNESDNYYDSSDSDEESTNDISITGANKNNVLIKDNKSFEDDYDNEVEIDDSEPDDEEEEEEDDTFEDEEDEEQFGGSTEDLDKNDDNAEIDEESDIEIDEDGIAIEKPNKNVKSKKTTQLIIADDEEDNDEYDENYLQKFDNDINKNYITEFHPECLNHNSDEVLKLSKIVRDENNIIIDPLHKTLPFLTKYEKARILGQRAKQIETGSKPFIKVPENIIDSYIIAELELREKKIPFIIKRPIPSGAFEYWNVKDLENINF